MLNYSVMVIPLGLVQTIQNLIPFFVLIISYYALNETLRKLEILNMIISFMSVAMIITFSTTGSRSSED